MKLGNNKWVHKLVATLVLGILPGIIFSQPPPIFEDPDAPIDGGLGLLLAAGVGYGIKKAHERKNRKEKASDSSAGNSI